MPWVHNTLGHNHRTKGVNPIHNQDHVSEVVVSQQSLRTLLGCRQKVFQEQHSWWWPGQVQGLEFVSSTKGPKMEEGSCLRIRVSAGNSPSTGLEHLWLRTQWTGDTLRAWRNYCTLEVAKDSRKTVFSMVTSSDGQMCATVANGTQSRVERIRCKFNCGMELRWAGCWSRILQRLVWGSMAESCFQSLSSEVIEIWWEMTVEGDMPESNRGTRYCQDSLYIKDVQVIVPAILNKAETMVLVQIGGGISKSSHHELCRTPGMT